MSDLSQAAVAVKKNPTIEEWRNVPGFPGYEVSNLGRMRSSKSGALRILSGWKAKGYPTVALRKDGRTFCRQIHRLVLIAFVGPCPEFMEGCHSDGNPENNQLSNLRWDTSSNNKHDIVEHGNHYSANKETCPRGHALEGRNLVRSSLKLGRRHCRACNRAYARVHRHGGDFVTIAQEEYESVRSAA